MTDPYAILGLTPDADDDAIRARYLVLTREFPPESFPEKSAAVRLAYDTLKNLDARVEYRLFGAMRTDSMESIIQEVACQTPRRRITLNELLRVMGLPDR